MSPCTAKAIWIIGEALMLCAGAFAVWSIIRDTRTAWPRIVAILKGEDNDA